MILWQIHYYSLSVNIINCGNLRFMHVFLYHCTINTLQQKIPSTFNQLFGMTNNSFILFICVDVTLHFYLLVSNSFIIIIVYFFSTLWLYFYSFISLFWSFFIFNNNKKWVDAQIIKHFNIMFLLFVLFFNLQLFIEYSLSLLLII